jgi:hypothetical protein
MSSVSRRPVVSGREVDQVCRKGHAPQMKNLTELDKVLVEEWNCS